MPSEQVCPRGCVDDQNAFLELEFGLDKDRKPAFMCIACDHSSRLCLYYDLGIDLTVA